MIVEGHVRDGLRVELSTFAIKSVVALDRAADDLLIDDDEDGRFCEQRDVPVDGGLRDVGQASAHFGGRPRSVARKGIDDPDPDRVQEQLEDVHGSSAGLIRSFSYVRTVAPARLGRP